MRIVENWSRVRGRIETWTAPRALGAPGELSLRVEGVEEVARPDGAPYPSLLGGSEGQVLRVRVPAGAAAKLRLRVGSRVTLQARRGRQRDVVFAHPDRIELSPHEPR